MSNEVSCIVRKTGKVWTAEESKSKRIFARGKSQREVITKTLTVFRSENPIGKITITDIYGKIKMEKNVKPKKVRKFTYKSKQ